MVLNVLEQAAGAAQTKNWSLLNQCLQQLPPNKKLANIAETAAGDRYIQDILKLALEVLEMGDFQDRWEAAKIFGRLGNCAVAPLIAILEDDRQDWELRWFAARILGEFQHPTVISALADVLKTSDNEELIAIASGTLAGFGTVAIPALIGLLADEDTKATAVMALSQIRHSETITPLLSVVDDPQVAVRTAAIEALSSFHDERIPLILLEALKDVAAAVRREAVIGLGVRVDLRDKFDLVNRFRSLLWDFNLDVCTASAIALGRMGNDCAAQALFEVLQSPNTPLSLQIQTIRALSWIATPQALSYLQTALISRAEISLADGQLGQKVKNNSNLFTQWGDRSRPNKHSAMISQQSSLSNQLVCQEIIAVLGRVEQPELKPIASQILIEAFKANDWAVGRASIKQTLATSLGQLADPQGINLLTGLLADPDEGVKWHAIAALKKIPQAKAIAWDNLKFTI